MVKVLVVEDEASIREVIALNLLPIVLIAMLPSVLACVIFVWVPVGFVLSALLIQNRLEDERKGTAGMTERKLKRKIDEKKRAHGLRQG